MIPYLILRVTAFDFASGLIPVNIEHWSQHLEFGWSRPHDAGTPRLSHEFAGRFPHADLHTNNQVNPVRGLRKGSPIFGL
jgi:hypothetical protein